MDKYVYNEFGTGKGLTSTAFKNCFNKNCYTTKNRSLLYDPKKIVNAIVFFGIGIPRNDNEFKKIKQFKMNQQLVKEKNGGIIPKIVLYMRVKFLNCINF